MNAKLSRRSPRTGASLRSGRSVFFVLCCNSLARVQSALSRVLFARSPYLARVERTLPHVSSHRVELWYGADVAASHCLAGTNFVFQQSVPCLGAIQKCVCVAVDCACARACASVRPVLTVPQRLSNDVFRFESPYGRYREPTAAKPAAAEALHRLLLDY